MSDHEPDDEPEISGVAPTAVGLAAKPEADEPDTFPSDRLAGSEPPAARAARDLAIGELLGGTYEIRGVLGSGGMGKVYEAHDRSLNRLVAIKAAHGDASANALRSEARALAALRHPGLVTVHAMGTHEGADYLVMERLFGLTLSQHIDKRLGRSPFTVEEALDILIGIADALSCVHRAHLAHRDLKPGNIILATNSRVVLLDFGIFEIERHAGEEKVVSGTPQYIAPEWIRNTVKPGEAHLGDIYALGCIAFELLTGAPPFDDPHVARLLAQHLEETAPRVSDRRPDLPVHLDRLIAEMLAKRTDERPASVDVVGAWLCAIRRGLSTAEAAPPLSVLIADDDPEMRHLLETCVQHAVPSAEIRLASDGVQALHMFLRRPAQVLLVDLMMPGMNGIELCMQLRGTAAAEQTTIVAVSAHASERDRRLLGLLGVIDFVDKKTSSDQLISELVALIESIYTTRTRILGDHTVAP